MSTEEKVDLNELVNAYLTIRRERDILKQNFEAKEEELKAEMSALESIMLTACNDIKADSIRTEHGTIIRSLKETYVCSDWTNFKKFIVENAAPDLLQQRIHQSNFKEFMQHHEGEGLPPGVSSMREFAIVVRKPTNK